MPNCFISSRYCYLLILLFAIFPFQQCSGFSTTTNPKDHFSSPAPRVGAGEGAGEGEGSRTGTGEAGALSSPPYSSSKDGKYNSNNENHNYNNNYNHTYPRKWFDRFTELKNFYEENGHSDVGSAQNQTTLVEWVYRQRKEHRKIERGEQSSMTDEMIALLDTLDFVWDMNQKAWDDRFVELLKFQKEFGNVNVPKKYKTLGQWLTKQRKEYRVGELAPSRVKRLNDIGMVWDMKEWTFQQRLQELKKYKETHGHLRVKLSDGDLGPWFYSRRKEYLQWLNGESTTLRETHRLALEEVGFGPNLKERRLRDSKTEVFSWHDRYDQLIFFKRVHGHVRVPSSYGTLGSWVQYQRSRQDKMPDCRRKMLDQAGFVWNFKEWQWGQRFNELEAYKKRTGNTDVPMSHGELGEWVQVQRVQRSLYMRGKKSLLTARRVTKLNQIGFDWARGSTQNLQRDLAFYRRLNELKQWKAEHNNLNVPRSSPLGKWTASQRQRYKSYLEGDLSSISKKRRDELKGIGLFD